MEFYKIKCKDNKIFRFWKYWLEEEWAQKRVINTPFFRFLTGEGFKKTNDSEILTFGETINYSDFLILLEYFKLGMLTVNKFFIERVRILFDISGFLGVPDAFEYSSNELSIVNDEYLDRRNYTLNSDNPLTPGDKGYDKYSWAVFNVSKQNETPLPEGYEITVPVNYVVSRAVLSGCTYFYIRKLKES